MRNTVKTTRIQDIFRVILGAGMVFAGTGHLSFLRTEFQAQVPRWVPADKDLVVVLSGVLEIGLGTGLVFAKKHRIKMGIALAIFYVLVFPGNIAQYADQRDAFGLDTDTKRLLRLFFQPVLIAWVLWSTGAFTALKRNT